MSAPEPTAVLAGAWVKMESLADLPYGTRIREEWRYLESRCRYYVHRDDLPTDPDAEVEAGMTVEDAETALADADTWVEVRSLADLPKGTHRRMEWRHMEGGCRYYVHRDDLPPTVPERGDFPCFPERAQR